MVVPPISVLTFFAVAHTMLPMTPRAAPPTNIQRRPKISDTRPMMVRVTAEVSVYERATQTMFGSCRVRQRRFGISHDSTYRADILVDKTEDGRRIAVCCDASHEP